jgi:hypothetical protein
MIKQEQIYQHMGMEARSSAASHPLQRCRRPLASVAVLRIAFLERPLILAFAILKTLT